MKPEARLVTRFNNLLDKVGPVYHQGMFTPYSNGTPDQYYEGHKDAVFVEFKWKPRKATLGNHISIDIAKLLSPLQRVWARRRRTNGHAAWVVVGLGNDLVVVDVGKGPLVGVESKLVMPLMEVVQFVYSAVGASCAYATEEKPSRNVRSVEGSARARKARAAKISHVARPRRHRRAAA